MNINLIPYLVKLITQTNHTENRHKNVIIRKIILIKLL